MKALIFLVVLLPVGALGQAPSSRTVEVHGPVTVGGAAPTFAGWDAEGRMVSLRDLLPGPEKTAGGPILVSFFATWCEPCKKGLPAMARLKERLAREDLRVVLVAFGQSADEFKPWLEKEGIDLPALADPFGKISARYGVAQALPRTFVLDGEGTIRAIFVLEGVDFEERLGETILASSLPAEGEKAGGAAP